MSCYLTQMLVLCFVPLYVAFYRKGQIHKVSTIRNSPHLSLMVAQWDRLYFSCFPPGEIEARRDLVTYSRSLDKIKNGRTGTYSLHFT